MSGGSYKKYMKKGAQKDFSLIQLFIVSFCGMLIFFTFIFKTFSPSVDVSIGDTEQDNDNSEETVVNVDERLSAIQDEDQGKSFMDLMRKAEDINKPDEHENNSEQVQNTENFDNNTNAAESVAPGAVTQAEPVYKVFIGSYTSAEQAKVAKDIIQDAGLNLTPIVKCLGSNDYTLQVGIYKNKTGAETLLQTIRQNHLPGRIVVEN